MARKVKYRCWYSGKKMTKKETHEVDKILKEMDGEDLEFLYDNLPKSTRSRKEPYVHVPSRLGYPVLNLSKEVLNKTLKKIFKDRYRG